jgi:mannose-6-phosphate isomerase
LLIEAGTVHALGAGLLVAEIQQASDTTYRLFDWNRVDRDGKPRELHIPQALDTIDFTRGPVNPVQPKATGAAGIERQVTSDKFILDRRAFAAEQTLAHDDRFHILAVVDGAIYVRAHEFEHTLNRGNTLLVPASAQDVRITPQGHATVLDMYLP